MSTAAASEYTPWEIVEVKRETVCSRPAQAEPASFNTQEKRDQRPDFLSHGPDDSRPPEVHRLFRVPAWSTMVCLRRTRGGTQVLALDSQTDRQERAEPGTARLHVSQVECQNQSQTESVVTL